MPENRRRKPGAGGAESGLPDGAQPEPEASEKSRWCGRRFTVAEQAALLAAFEASGQTCTDFCVSHDVSRSTLGKWLKAKREASGGGAHAKPGRSTRRRARTHRPYTPEERRRAVEEYERSGLSAADFCRTWGVSTGSLATWLKRYREEGPKGLEPKPRKPTAADDARKLPEAVKAAIVTAKRQYPESGLRKVRDVLQRFCGIRVSLGSVAKTLREEGIAMLPKPRRRPRPRKKPPRRFERARPGEMWQSDITSYVLARHHRRVYLTVFMDDHSRYVVGWGLHLHQKQDIVIEALLNGIASFGKPREVLTDQGRQYYAWRGKSAFQKLLDKEGLQHVVSRPHHPQTLGKCERFWGTVDREFWSRAKPDDLQDARARLGHFIDHYNHFRPHQGINGLVPADRFFGAGDHVRRSLEAQMAANELQLAIDQPPRKPVYLFGQIGDQQVSLHGEQGRLVIQTPNGVRQEMELNDLGVSPQENGDGGTRTGSHEKTPRSPETDSSRQEADPLQASEDDADLGAGALGTRQRGGEGAGAHDVRGDPGVLGGTDVEAGRRGSPGRASTSGLAAQSASLGGYAGGAARTTTNSGETTDGARPERRPEASSQEGREPGEAARGGEDPDRCAPGSSDEQGPQASEKSQADGRRDPRLGKEGRGGKNQEGTSRFRSVRWWLAPFGRRSHREVADDDSRSSSP